MVVCYIAAAGARLLVFDFIAGVISSSFYPTIGFPWVATTASSFSSSIYY
jgi:hypothetical protein